MNPSRPFETPAGESAQDATRVLPGGAAQPPADELELARFALLGTGVLPSKPNLTLARHLAFLPHDALTLDLDDPEQRDFGDYELKSHLGQGGMGVVYLARQKSLDREVAVKLLAAGPWASTDFIEQFRREARSAARMAHPNIVPIYEIGQYAELNFYAMRLVRGPSLATVLARQEGMAPLAAATLMRTVAEAVDYAHRLGVLHLDLKPGNLLIDENGAPQVADFGLARQLDETLSAEATEVSGTPSYMAPEQAELRRHRLSPATDIYGLGAILYEALTGRPPFVGGNAQETLQRLLAEEPPRPRQLDRRIPVDLEAICLKCLAKDPRGRYPSARALADDLGRFLDGRPVSVRPPRVHERIARWIRREPRLALSLLAFVLALLLGLIATWVQWRRADAHAASARTHLWATRAQTAQAALAEGDSFRGLRGLVSNLAEMENEGREPEARVERQRIGTALAHAPMLLRQLAVPDAGFISAVALSPDGQRVAVATLGNQTPRLVREYDLNTGRERWQRNTLGLTRALAMADGAPHGRLSYSADGRILFAHVLQMPPFAAPMLSDTIALDAATGEPWTPPPEWDRHADLIYSPDATVALLRFRSDPSLRFPDLVQLVRPAGWQPLGPKRSHATLDHAIEWQFSPDSRWLLGSGDFARLTLYAVPGLEPRWQWQWPEQDLLKAWTFSPDSRWLAIGTVSGSVWLVDLQSGQREALSSGLAGIVRWLAFAADGRTLAAISEDELIAVWDVPTRRLRALPLVGAPQQGLPMLRLAGDQLFSAGTTELRSWTLSPLAPFDNNAVPGSARLRGLRRQMAHAFDVHAGLRLLASGDQSGRLSIWQLPQGPLIPAQWRDAPLPVLPLAFDGQRLVAVRDTEVQLRDVRTAAPRSGAFRHPAPVQLAALAPDHRHLLTVAARTVRSIDLAAERQVGDGFRLPQTPLRATLADSTPVAALAVAEPEPGGLSETLYRVDLPTAAVTASSWRLRGPLQLQLLSPDGGLLLVLERPSSTPTAPRLLTWDREVCALPAMNTTRGSFAADGRSLWLHRWGRDRRHTLVQFSTADCRELASFESTQGGESMRPVAVAGRVVINGFGNDTVGVVAADGSRREVRGLPRALLVHAFAVSADGRRAAQATRSGVQLLDLDRGERVSTLLNAPLAGNDGIAELAFAPDGDALLGRTVQGRWLHWSFPDANMPVAALERQAQVLDPDNDAVLPALWNPPPWPAVTATVDSAAATGPALVLADVADPVSSPALEPLDLAAVANVRMDGSWPSSAMMSGDALTLAPGLQRLAGIDWLIGAALQLSSGGTAVTLHPRTPSLGPIGFRRGSLKRVHLLMLLHIPLRPDAPPRTMLWVDLAGVDGRTHALAVHSRRDIVTNWQPELAYGTARVAWSGVFPNAVREGSAGIDSTAAQMYAVALEVPAQTGLLQALSLRVPDGPMEAPLVYAITLERADTAD